MEEVKDKLASLNFDTSEVSRLSSYLLKLYQTDKKLFDEFYDNLISNNKENLLKLIDKIPTDIRDILEKANNPLEVLFGKISELLSLFSESAKIAFKHAQELAEKEPEKAKYIFTMALVGMMISYIFGKRSR